MFTTIVRFSSVNYTQLAMTQKSILMLQQLHLYAAPFHKQKLSRLFNNRNTSPMFWFRFFFPSLQISPPCCLLFFALFRHVVFTLFSVMSFCLWRRSDFLFVLNVLEVLISLLYVPAKPSLEVDVSTRNMYFMFWSVKKNLKSFSAPLPHHLILLYFWTIFTLKILAK